MTNIPGALLGQIEQGKVLMFVGERTIRSADDQFPDEQLRELLAAHVGFADIDSFQEAAQAFEDRDGRQALVQFVQTHWEELEKGPQLVHRLIARLDQCRVLATTCVDDHIERAFASEDRNLNTFIGNAISVISDESKTQLHKLFGSLQEESEQRVLTEDDYEAFFENPDAVSPSLRAHLAHNTILFIGCDLANPYFKRLYRKITTDLDSYGRQHYAIWETPTKSALLWCKRHRIEIVTASAAVFMQSLFEQLDMGTQAVPTVASPLAKEKHVSVPKRPYKLLDYYEAKDAEIFYGRQHEIQQLASLVHAHRLVLLYGASGVGKTSLLLAGVGPLLKRSGTSYELVHVRALEDPGVSIQQAVQRRLPRSHQVPNVRPGLRVSHREQFVLLRRMIRELFNESELRDICFDLGIDYEELAGSSKRDRVRELINYCDRRGRLSELTQTIQARRPQVPWPESMLQGSNKHIVSTAGTASVDPPLVEFLDTASRLLGRTLVIILDQFEEFFIRLSKPIREAFISELGDLYDARDVRAKIVLGIREDWLAAVGEMEERIPELFRIRMRLLALTHEQARRAIEAPAAKFGRQYEPQLLDKLMAELAVGDSTSVMPPQLQLVCSALYDALGSDENTITLAVYESLGGARRILKEYLNDELSRLPHDEQAIARQILEELVTSQGTKAVRTKEQLALSVNTDLLHQVLDKLVQARLLRVLRSDEGAEAAFELAHEYLVSEISLDDEYKTRKRAEELLSQEVENWRRFRFLMSGEKLDLIWPVRYSIHPAAEARELLFRSAIVARRLQAGFWQAQVYPLERQVAVLKDVTLGKYGGIVPSDVLDALERITGDRRSSPAIKVAAEDIALRTFKVGRGHMFKAAKFLVKLSEGNPELAGRAIDVLVDLLKEENKRTEVVGALEVLAGVNLETAAQVSEVLLELLTDENEYVQVRTVAALQSLSADDPALAARAVEILVRHRKAKGKGLTAEAEYVLEEKGLSSFDAVWALVGSTDWTRSKGFWARVMPANLIVEPGQDLAVEVMVWNQSHFVDHYYFSVQDLPPKWVTLHSEKRELLPGTEEPYPMMIHPPRESGSTAGLHKIHLTITASYSQETVNIIRPLTIVPFELFSVEMRPAHLKNEGVCRVQVLNRGNAVNNFSLVCRDPAEALRFELQDIDLSLSPEQVGTLEVAVAPKSRRFLGIADQAFPFEVQVHSSRGGRQTISGQMEVQPHISIWVLLIFLLLAFIISVLLLVSLSG